MISTVKLSKGYEFSLCGHDVINDTIEFTILFDGTYTAEQMLEIWKGNTSFVLTLVDEFENISVENYEMYTICSLVTLLPHSAYKEIHRICKSCHNIIMDDEAHICPNCEANLQNDDTTELIAQYVEDKLLCKIVCRKATPIERIADIENAIETLINAALN